MTRALVTGGAGFIRSNLVDPLTEQDLRVTVVDQQTSSTSDPLKRWPSNTPFSFENNEVPLAYHEGIDP